MTGKADVVIVGGGLGGLATAGLLAKRGRTVALLERASAPGGRAATHGSDGFSLNLGGHALYRRGPAERVLGELRVSYSGKAPNIDGKVVVAGESFVLPTGAGSLLRTRVLSARAKLEFGSLLARLPALDLAPLEEVPLSRWLDKHTRDARVRSLVEMLVRLSTYANAPGHVSAAAAFRQLRLASEAGVLYLDGGWQTLVSGLAEVGRATGVETTSGAVVVEVARAGEHWRVQTADGRAWDAPSVVLATGPRAAEGMIRGSAKVTLEGWAGACVPAYAACLDVALSRLPQLKPTFALGLDAPLYFSVHSNAARLAPGDGAVVHAMRYLAPGELGRPDEHARELESWLDLCQPGWREVVVKKRSLPEMVATNDIHRASGGGSTGRPGPSVPGAPGLFVVGDWVGSEGMLADASFASAARAVEEILASARRMPSFLAAS